MINNIKSIVKTLGIETSKSTKTSIKGCKNMSTRGINIKNDKFNPDEVLICYTKIDNKTIEKITNTLKENGYNTKVVPGIIIVSK